MLIVSAPTTSGYEPMELGVSTEFPTTVRVAAIQATPVILDAEASIDKAIGLLTAAGERGARLAVLPECFVPLYPSNAWARERVGLRRLERVLGATVGERGRRPWAASSIASSRSATNASCSA